MDIQTNCHHKLTSEDIMATKVKVIKTRGKNKKLTNKQLEKTIKQRKELQTIPTAHESVQNDAQKGDSLLTVLPVLTRYKIDVPKAVELRKHGLTYQEIATYFGCTRTSVHAALKKYGLITERVKVFRKHRANVLSELQEVILRSISIKDIQKASMPARVLAFCQLYDKERLERDLSTANVATLHDDIANLKAKKLEQDKK